MDINLQTSNQITTPEALIQSKIDSFIQEFTLRFTEELKVLIKQEAKINPRFIHFLNALNEENLRPEFAIFNSTESENLLRHWTTLYQAEVSIREEYEQKVHKQHITKDRKYSPYTNPEYPLPIKTSITNGNRLVVFRLPKILEYFWWKKNYDSTVIEWGMFYEKILPVMYKIRDELIKKSDLKFKLLNEDKVHVPGEFYYIWEVRMKKN